MTKLQTIKIKELKEENKKLRKIINQIKHSTKCPYCFSMTSIKHGKRETKKGLIQRYECLNCNKKFSIREESFRMRHDSDLIEKVIKLHKKGYSSREIAKNIKEVSHVTITRWIKDFIEI